VRFPTILYVAFSAAAATIFGLNAISVATPGLAMHFRVDINAVSLATSTYLLAEIVSMCMLPLFLRKFTLPELLKNGCAGFAIASIFCFLSPHFDALVVGRLFQGFFAGLMLPLPLLFTQHYVEKTSRFDALGHYGMSTIVLPVIAPLITLSLPLNQTHWVFLFLATMALPGLIYSGTPPALKIENNTKGAQRFSPGNIASFLLIASGLGLGLWTIEHWADWQGWSSFKTQFSSLLSITLFSIGVVAQTEYKNPLFDWRIYLHWEACMTLFMSLLLGVIVYGMIYLIPLYVVMVHEGSPSTIFKVVAWAAIPQIIMYPFFMRYKHLLPPHVAVAAGFFIMAAMTFYFSLSGVDFGPGSMWQVQLPRAVAALLLGLTFNAVLLDSTPSGLEVGMSTQYSVVRTLGGALGIALTNTYIEYRYQHHIQNTQAYGSIGTFTEKYAIDKAFNDTFLILSLGLLGSALFSLWLYHRKNQRNSI
jgi:DHA2 family multidrug resistance protein